MKLKLQNITGGYTHGHDILQGVNLTVESGQTVGIIGLNGSGKSTLAKAVTNTLPFRQGGILIDGVDVSRKTARELSGMGISLFLQGGRVFEELSVWENLAVVAGNDLQSLEISSCLSLLQQPRRELQKLRADRLSGGQRHQLALAMCLLRQPKLLLLDEPSAGLAPVAVEKMYNTLETLRQNRTMTIILVEQNVAKAIQFCDSINMLKNGKFVYCSDKKDIKEIEKIMFTI
jgi:ABC-type branched-subunit amino acid transport system ATPase component